MTEKPLPHISISFQGQTFEADVCPLPMQQYFVCFMDLLGTTANIQSGNDKQSAEVLFALSRIFGQMRSAGIQDLKIKTFSDNICLFVPIPQDLETAKSTFQWFLEIVSVFQVTLLQSTGELIRGGIAAGQAFFDNDFVWGKALSDAYLIESHKAEVPIIGIDPATYKIYAVGNCKGFILKRTSSTIPFLNYYATLSASQARQLFSTSCDTLKKKISAFKEGQDIKCFLMDKICWTARFLNAVSKYLGLEEPFDFMWEQNGQKTSLTPPANFL